VVEIFTDVILQWYEVHRMDEGLAEHEEKIKDFLLYFEKTWIGKNKVISFKPFVYRLEK
jgi:hypothetical protein